MKIDPASKLSDTNLIKEIDSISEAKETSLYTLTYK